MAPSRRSTFNPADIRATPLQPRKTMTWTVFAQQPTQPAEPRLHLALFPKYWLSHEKLETWLRKKFPEYVGMFDIEIRNDKWAFYIPRPLTQDDQGDLINERDELPTNAPRSRSQSVEP